MNDKTPATEQPLVIVYCTMCGHRVLEDVDTGERCVGAVRLPRPSIELLRRTGKCMYCDGAMDAEELPEE